MPESSSRARLLVGLISGTSLDGIDAALVGISGSATRPRVRLRAFETLPYPGWLRTRLLAIAGGAATTAEEIDQLHTFLGALFGEAAIRVCRRARVKPQNLFAIGSHGQTIHHQGGRSQSQSSRSQGRGALSGKRGFWSEFSRKADPQGRRVPLPCTLQIAEPALIAELTGARVVADFRTADMAAGGQGAPLVPMVDYLLLRDARQGTVALNIGGIANVTVIPAGATSEQVFGFDTGPGNMIIDGLVRQFSKRRRSYDAGGEWASRGKVIEPLLAELLQHPFFAQAPPKSAGHEQFGQHFIEQFFLSEQNAFSRTRKKRSRLAQIDNRKSKIENSDLLRTATEFTARTIADALERFVLKDIALHRLIISGGGAHNRLLVARLGELLPKLRIYRSSEFGLDVDAKEAIAFAVLADRSVHGLPGNLPSVTGARRAVVLGKVSQP